MQLMAGFVHIQVGCLFIRSSCPFGHISMHKMLVIWSSSGPARVWHQYTYIGALGTCMYLIHSNHQDRFQPFLGKVKTPSLPESIHSVQYVVFTHALSRTLFVRQSASSLQIGINQFELTEQSAGQSLLDRVCCLTLVHIHACNKEVT